MWHFLPETLMAVPWCNEETILNLGFPVCKMGLRIKTQDITGEEEAKRMQNPVTWSLKAAPSHCQGTIYSPLATKGAGASGSQAARALTLPWGWGGVHAMPPKPLLPPSLSEVLGVISHSWEQLLLRAELIARFPRQPLRGTWSSGETWVLKMDFSKGEERSTHSPGSGFPKEVPGQHMGEEQAPVHCCPQPKSPKHPHPPPQQVLQWSWDQHTFSAPKHASYLFWGLRRLVSVEAGFLAWSVHCCTW